MIVLGLGLGLGSQVLGLLGLGLHTCVLDSITVSDDDDVSALWQPFYESCSSLKFT